MVLSVAALMAVMMVATAGAALADAKPNEHNCTGDYFSGGSEIVKGGALGDYASNQAKRGIRGDVLKDFTDDVSNCGDNR